MKTSEDFKKLLNFLEEQNKKERKGYNQGVDVPLLFKLTKDKDEDLLVDGESIHDDKFIGYLSDLIDLDIKNYIFSSISEIPKEELKPTFPEVLLVSEELDNDSSTNLSNSEDLDILDEFSFPDDFDEVNDIDAEDYDEEGGVIVVEISNIINSIKEIMDSKNLKEAYILLNYNLYQYGGDIFVIDPSRCYDRSLNSYGLNIIKKSIGVLGL